METISDYMSIDHKQCDDVFAALERSVAEGHWEKATHAFREFHNAMQQHFAMEEDVLFPAFEQATGSNAGPTNMMRIEHQEIRGIIDELQQALDQRDAENFAGIADTLNIMLQQHNMKEEGILYPMADRVLSHEREALLHDMNNLTVTA